MPARCPRKTAARHPFLSCTSVTSRVLGRTAVCYLLVAQRVLRAQAYETWLLLRYERYQNSFSRLVGTLGTSRGRLRYFQHPVCCCHAWQCKYLNVWRVLVRAINYDINICVIRLLSVRSLFRCWRLPALVEKLPEIVIPCGYKNAYCSCAYFSIDAERKPCYHWNSWKWVRKSSSYPENNWFFFLSQCPGGFCFCAMRWESDKKRALCVSCYGKISCFSGEEKEEEERKVAGISIR